MTDDPRVEAADLVREFICEFWIDKPQMKWTRTTLDDGMEMVAHQGDTIFFGDPNHREPPDTARFDLIVKLANATPLILQSLASIQEAQREAIRQAVRDCWVCDVNKPSWFRDDQNERLVERILAAVTTSKSDAPIAGQQQGQTK